MIYITGDAHGEYFPFMYRFRDHTLTADDIVIVTGDFSFVQDTPKHREKIGMLKELPCTFAFIDGNHEQFDILDSLPVTKWCGGKVHKATDNIIHLMRGQCFNINGKSFFTMGGAYSVDKAMRVEGINWFRKELPDNNDYRTASATLEAHGYKFDYILTHTVPDAVLYPLGFGPGHDSELTGFLQWVYTNTEFVKWYAGHFHVDRSFLGGSVQILYEDVVEIK